MPSDVSFRLESSDPAFISTAKCRVYIEGELLRIEINVEPDAFVEGTLKLTLFSLSGGGSIETELRIEIQPRNDPPRTPPLNLTIRDNAPTVQRGFAFFAAGSRSVSGQVKPNDSLDGIYGVSDFTFALSLNPAEQPTHGAVELFDDGSFIYTPVDGYYGIDEFYIIITEVGNNKAQNPAPGVLPAGVLVTNTDDDLQTKVLIKIEMLRYQAPTDPGSPDGGGSPAPAKKELLQGDSTQAMVYTHLPYVTGTGNNRFGPDSHMTRAEAAQMFYNLFHDKNVKAGINYPDVKPNAWYATAVHALAAHGVIRGYPDGLYHPQDSITRAQFATIVVKIAATPSMNTEITPLSELGNAEAKNGRFSDVSADHWAYAQINIAASNGWIVGTGNGGFAPGRKITRGEAVTMINRMLRRYPDKDYISNHDNLIRYIDLSQTHWAYYEILEASNKHEYMRQGDSEMWITEKNKE